MTIDLPADHMYERTQFRGEHTFTNIIYLCYRFGILEVNNVFLGGVSVFSVRLRSKLLYLDRKQTEKKKLHPLKSLLNVKDQNNIIFSFIQFFVQSKTIGLKAIQRALEIQKVKNKP